MLTCLPLLTLVIQLNQSQGQHQMITGREDRGQVVQTYVNLETATWTFVTVKPDGTACILATGTNLMVTTPLEAN